MKISTALSVLILASAAAAASVAVGDDAGDDGIECRLPCDYSVPHRDDYDNVEDFRNSLHQGIVEALDK